MGQLGIVIHVICVKTSRMAAKSINPIDKHVGSRVRMRRLILGISQEKLSDASGRTFQQLQKYEKGKNRISSSRMQQIANALQVEPAFFFDGAASNPVPAANMPDYVSEMLTSRDGVGLVKAFMQIRDEKLKRAIVHLVQELGARHGE
jgi:transcriptional regulator with XRE-family HTH domain